MRDTVEEKAMKMEIKKKDIVYIIMKIIQVLKSKILILKLKILI